MTDVVASRRPWRAFVVVALVVCVFAAVGTLRPVADPDLHWHLATGRWIVEHRAVPRVDPFSHTFAGQPWRLVDWASDVVLALVHRWWGVRGLQLVTAGTVAVAMAVAALRMRRAVRPGSLLLGVLFLLLIYASSAFRFSVRPQTFMMVLVGIELWLFERADGSGRRRWPWWVVPLIALWSNVHGSSFIGVTLVEAYVVGRLFALRASPWSVVRNDVLEGCILGALSVLAAFAAPNPLGRFSTVKEVFFSSYVQRTITEWQRTEPSMLLGPLGILAAMSLLGFVVDRGRVPFWEVLVHGVVAWLAVRHVRFVPLFALVTGPAGYVHLAMAVDRVLGSRGATRPVRWVEHGLVACVLTAAWVIAYGLDVPTRWLGGARRPRWGLARDLYPVAAADFLARERLQGRMFNSFVFGGYLIERLGPRVGAFVDGRTSNVYSEEFLRDVVNLGPHNWVALFDRYRIEYAVVVHDALGAAIAAHPAWQLVFFDDVAMVLVRRQGANTEVARRRGYQLLTPGRLFGGFAREMLVADTLARLRAEAERAVREAPHAALPLEMRAMVRAAQGDLQGFEQDLRTATVRNPELPDPWYRLGRYHLFKGRHDVARQEFERAVALRPEVRSYREMLAIACWLEADHDGARAAAATLARPGQSVDDVLEGLSRLPWVRQLREQRVREAGSLRP